MLKIHYSDEASSLIGNSSPWWITLFQLKYLSHRSNEIYHLTEIYFSDKNSSPRWNFINLMKWWKFIPHDIVGIVDSSLWWIFIIDIVDSSLRWIFITLIKLKNMMKTHYSWKIHPSEFIAMLKIHYSDKASLLIRNSSETHRWKFIKLMKFWKLIPHDIVSIVDSWLW